MEIEFYRGLCEKLLQNEFKILKDGKSKDELDDDNIFFTTIKQTGASLCMVTAVRAEKTNTEELREIVDRQTALAEKIAENINVNQVIMLSLIICPDKECVERSRIENDIYARSERTIEARWIVDIEDKEITAGKGQPTKISGIEKIINELLSDKESVRYAKTMDEAVEKTADKDLREMSSGNFMLTNIIFVINLIVFALMELDGGSENYNTLISYGALSHEKVLIEHEYIRLITSMFIHIGFLHLAHNTLALYIFAKRIEQYKGKTATALIYLMSGISGGIAELYFSDAGVCAGASGAIFGIEGAMLGYCMREKRSIGGLNIYMMIIFVFMGISLGFFDENVGNAAHIGGFICGFAMSFILREKK
ncbi:MAG: rhomboid family intramembrane serine protease [Firmicutes bacterium]|nr:rhomboid family intramembrane serine protease [Bacillota bacterium]